MRKNKPTFVPSSAAARVRVYSMVLNSFHSLETRFLHALKHLNERKTRHSCTQAPARFHPI